jgi:CRP-like cAMP-binding protein
MSQHYYVCAKAKTRVIFIDYEHVIKRCENACKFHSQMVSNLLQMIAMRASQQANRIYVLSRNSTRKKILAYLCEAAGENQDQPFKLPVSYTTLAEYLCVDRSAMMREFKNLSEEGVLFREGKNIRILL